MVPNTISGNMPVGNRLKNQANIRICLEPFVKEMIRLNQGPNIVILSTNAM